MSKAASLAAENVQDAFLNFPFRNFSCTWSPQMMRISVQTILFCKNDKYLKKPSICIRDFNIQFSAVFKKH